VVIFALSFLRGECDKGEERDVRVSLASAIWGENGGTHWEHKKWERIRIWLCRALASSDTEEASSSPPSPPQKATTEGL
jgi:hypothetical protein